MQYNTVYVKVYTYFADAIFNIPICLHNPETVRYRIFPTLDRVTRACTFVKIVSLNISFMNLLFSSSR